MYVNIYIYIYVILSNTRPEPQEDNQVLKRPAQSARSIGPAQNNQAPSTGRSPRFLGFKGL